MKIKKEAVLRRIADEYILIPVGEDESERTGFYVLSDVAKRIWELLPEVDTLEEIEDSLVKEYDVDRETLSEDARSFLERLQTMNFI